MVDDGALCELVVQRPHQGFRDKFRSYRIVVDGQPRGVLKAGRSVSLAVSAGHHGVEARIGSYGSHVRDLELIVGTTTTLFVGSSGVPVELLRSVPRDTYLALVDRREDLPQSATLVANVPQPRGPAWLRAVLAVGLFTYVVPPQLPALRSGEAWPVTAAVGLIAFWVWVAWCTFRRPTRPRAAYWRHQAWWWTGWLVFAAVIVGIGLSEHWLHPIALLYVAVPMLGALSSWTSTWLISRETVTTASSDDRL